MSDRPSLPGPDDLGGADAPPPAPFIPGPPKAYQPVLPELPGPAGPLGEVQGPPVYSPSAKGAPPANFPSLPSVPSVTQRPPNLPSRPNFNKRALDSSAEPALPGPESGESAPHRQLAPKTPSGAGKATAPNKPPVSSKPTLDRPVPSAGSLPPVPPAPPSPAPAVAMDPGPPVGPPAWTPGPPAWPPPRPADLPDPFAAEAIPPAPARLPASSTALPTVPSIPAVTTAAGPAVKPVPAVAPLSSVTPSAPATTVAAAGPPTVAASATPPAMTVPPVPPPASSAATTVPPVASPAPKTVPPVGPAAGQAAKAVPPVAPPASPEVMTVPPVAAPASPPAMSVPALAPRTGPVALPARPSPANPAPGARSGERKAAPAPPKSTPSEETVARARPTARKPTLSFHDRLRERAGAVGHILCLGLDPDLERLKMTYSQAFAFFNDLLEAVQPAAIKPNAAYFEMYGSTGWTWLERLIRRWRNRCPIILDVKRGDIGPSSKAYARSAFERLGVDAVTVNPWMGRDSLAPFAEFAPRHGFYALVRTSNPGHADLQKAETGGQELWRRLFCDLPGWFAGAGAVVGATHLADLRWTCQNLKPDMPLLIPGVGAQGGSAQQVLAELRQSEVELHRVNVSSKIVHAHEDYPDLTPLEAAIKAFQLYSGQLKLG